MTFHNFNVGTRLCTFICGSANTRHGFKHVCVLFEDNKQTAECTRHYLNRTWESFRYQSAMLGAIDCALDLERARCKNILKLENGWDRMTEKRNTALQERLQASDTWVALNDLRKAVNDFRG